MTTRDVKTPDAILAGDEIELPDIDFAAVERRRIAREERDRAEKLSERHGPIRNGVSIASNLPRRFVDGSTSFDSFAPLAGPAATVKAWIETKDASPRWIYLAGNNGTGKTHIGMSALSLWILRDGYGTFARISSILDAARDVEERSRAMKFYSSTPLLVIDDVGAEKPTEFTVSILSELLDLRYSAERRTIITANLTLPELGDRLTVNGEETAAKRIIERIYEMTGGKDGAGRFYLDGESFRLR